jgi:iron complex transport system substrate-binding protein
VVGGLHTLERDIQPEIRIENMGQNQTCRRIACLQPSATSVLDAVGELDRVVACTRYCGEVVAKVANGSRMILSDSWSADAGQILSAKPDLVIAAVPYQEKAIAEILKAGVRFLGLAPKTLADIYTDIATIAGVVGASEEGERVIEEMQKHIEDVRSRVVKAKRLRVFSEEWGKPIIASQRWVAELVEAAGGEFVGAPGQQISIDEVRNADPDIIIAAWCGAGDRVPLDKIVSGRDWQDTSAAKAERVFCVRDEYLNTPAPTLMQGLDAIAWAIHPEIFPRTEGIRQITGIRTTAAGNRRL